jgi:hypothetical protein
MVVRSSVCEELAQSSTAAPRHCCQLNLLLAKITHFLGIIDYRIIHLICLGYHLPPHV